MPEQVQFGGMTIDELAGKVKAKHPDYASIANRELVAKLIRGHPVYQNQLSRDTLISLARGKDTSSILQGVGLEAAELGRSTYESVKETAILTGLTGGLAMPYQAYKQVVEPQLPLISRAAKETGQRIRHPRTPRPLYGLHMAEAFTPIAGPMAARLEEFPLREAIGRGAVDIAAVSGSELLRAVRSGAVKPTQLTVPQQVDIIGRSVQDAINVADASVKQQVSALAENVAKAVDDPQRNPVPAIDAKSFVAQLRTAWQNFIHTDTEIGHRVPPEVQKSVEEALGSNRWTFSQAKEVRSALSDYVTRSKDPQLRAIATEGAKQLRGQMQQAAKNAGVLKDFDAYNELHMKRMNMHRAVLRGVKTAPTGEAAMRKLHSNTGYVRNTVLPSLEKYGLDSKAVREALDATGEKPKPRLIHDWHTRYAAGALIHATTGLPWLAGAAGAGVATEALQPRLAVEGLRATPTYARGEQLVRESIAPGRTKVTPPTPLPEPAPAPSAQPPQRSVLPPVPSPRAVETAPAREAPPEPPPPPPDPYTGLQQRVNYTRALNRAISTLSRGAKKALSAEEISWVEQESGMSLRDPANLPRAIAALKEKLKALRGLPPIPKPGSP